MQTPPNSRDPQQSDSVQPIPEMVGATSAPFQLGAERTQISFAIHAPTGPALLRADMKPRRVFLNVENMTSSTDAPTYEVYLNLPPDGEPAKLPGFRAGVLAPFGLLESSRSSERNPGNGLTFKLDVTDVFLRLAATRQWAGKNLRVTFVPEPWPVAAKVSVGRVSLYFE